MSIRGPTSPEEIAAQEARKLKVHEKLMQAISKAPRQTTMLVRTPQRLNLSNHSDKTPSLTPLCTKLGSK